MDGISLIIDRMIHKRCQAEKMLADALVQNVLNPEFSKELGAIKKEIHDMCPYSKDHTTTNSKCWTCGWELMVQA